MTRLDDIREIVKALREAPNYNAGLGTSTLEDEAADLIDELTAEVKRWVDKHKQAALNFQQENAECRRLTAEVEQLREEVYALREDCAFAPMPPQTPAKYHFVDANKMVAGEGE